MAKFEAFYRHNEDRRKDRPPVIIEGNSRSAVLRKARKHAGDNRISVIQHCDTIETVWVNGWVAKADIYLPN